MNVVFMLSDRHTATFAECYGNALTRTPNLDCLAERGVRFENAYCLSPTCAPARASMMSGRYIHEIGAWCNSFPYTGVPRGWGHEFADQGVLYTTVGKLDFSPEADRGIEDERLSSLRSSRDVTTLFREETQPRFPFIRGFCETGPAETLNAYAKDISVAEESARWLREDRPEDRPWVLSVNFQQLHRPWKPTQDLWDYYDARVHLENLDERYTEDVSHLHPFQQAFTRYSGGEYVTLEDVRCGVVGYHGAVEILDRSMGIVLNALEEAGILEDTLVVYSSDHAGNCGEHRALDHGGLTEESIRVPLIMAGPDVKAGAVLETSVSVLDIFPSVCEALGCDLPEDKLGVSLMGIARGDSDPLMPEFALCQFHATGYSGSGFALRSGTWKFVECVGERPMLFNLVEDPHEMHDLIVERSEDLDVKAKVRELRKMLCGVCSPEAVDARAKADQLALREEMAASGQLFDELWRRGYERNADRLVPREETIMEPKVLV